MKQRTRRRYDTNELVGQIRRERRLGVLLAVGGAAMVVLFLGLYVAGIGQQGGSGDPPEDEGALAAAAGPTGADAGRQPAGKAQTEQEDAPAAAKAAAKPAAQPPSSEARPAGEVAAAPKRQDTRQTKRGPASVRMIATMSTVLSVDGKRVAKGKRQTFKIPAGEHSLEARFKRSTLRRKISFQAGHEYVVRIDGAKKKIFVKQVE